MPGVGTKQQQIPRAELPVASDRLLTTPDAVLGEFGQICVELPAAGAVIAVRNLAGLRCTVSFGNAPAVGSNLPMDSGFIAKCMQTGEIVLCEDIPANDRVLPAATESFSFRSAVTVPVQSQGCVMGVIQVFCAHPFAIDAATVANLRVVAKSFSILMMADAANDAPAMASESPDDALLWPPTNLAQEALSIAEPVGSLRREASPTERQREVNRSSAIGVLAEMARAIRARAAARAALAHLPSDKPTPTRVWLITAALLVVLSLLILLLFRATQHIQLESPENADAGTHASDAVDTRSASMERPGSLAVPEKPGIPICQNPGDHFAELVAAPANS